MARAIHKLSNRKCSSAKPGRHADGGGLYLVVSSENARSWLFMWKLRDGRRREMGLGSFRDVSLARARELAAAARADRAAGRDPIAERNARKAGTLTFGDAADKLIEIMEASWRNAKHRYQWKQTLNSYGATLRATPVDQVTTEHVLEVLRPIWLTKSETAARLRGRIERVLDFARARAWRSGENPARWRGHLDALLPRRAKLQYGHHPAMPFADVPTFVTGLRTMTGVGARALEFTILTAARTGEVLGAKWPEINFDQRLWIVPAERMKSGRQHRVPLSDRAVEILRDQHAMEISAFVFPGLRHGQALSNMAMKRVLERAGVTASIATVHGFRSSFRDWAGERTSFPREIAEAALAHVVGDAVERAYRRADALEKRRKLMGAWAVFCSASDASRVVVKLRARQK